MIYLGKIVKTRSNKGEVVFQPDPAIRFLTSSRGGTVILRSPKYEKSLEVEYIMEKHGTNVIKFTGINTIAEAYKLVGYSMFSDTMAIASHPTKNLVGFKVFDPEGVLWGTVQQVKENDANPLIEVGMGEKTILIPYHPEIVVDINYQTRELSINPPDGLKSLNSP